MQQTALWKNTMQRERQRKRDPERVNVFPLMVKPCILSDWLTGSAGAMLESNWVRVCELEERSLNVSHCCRRQTDRQWEKTSQSASAVTSHIYIISLSLYRDATPPVLCRWGCDVASSASMETKTNIANFHTEQQATTTVPEVREEVLNY